MAHIEKYKSGAVGVMFGHYERTNDNISNKNIDESKTDLNYAFEKNADKNKSLIRQFLERKKEILSSYDKKLKSDAVVLCDFLLTAPKDLKSKDYDRFFETAYIFAREKFGEKNVLTSYVHMDETTPHIHIPFLPIKDNRFNARGLIDRKLLNSFHRELQKKMDVELGYHVGILNGQTISKDRSMSVNELKKQSSELEDQIFKLQNDVNNKKRSLNELSSEEERLKSFISKKSNELEKARDTRRLIESGEFLEKNGLGDFKELETEKQLYQYSLETYSKGFGAKKEKYIELKYDELVKLFKNQIDAQKLESIKESTEKALYDYVNKSQDKGLLYELDDRVWRMETERDKARTDLQVFKTQNLDAIVHYKDVKKQNEELKDFMKDITFKDGKNALQKFEEKNYKSPSKDIERER